MIINALLLLIPISVLLEHVFHAPPVWIFVTGILAIIPLAEWIRRATEHMARLAGPMTACRQTPGSGEPVSARLRPSFILRFFASTASVRSECVSAISACSCTRPLFSS